MVLLKKSSTQTKKHVRYLNLVVWDGTALPANKDRALLAGWGGLPTSRTGWDPSGGKEENGTG